MMNTACYTNQSMADMACWMRRAGTKSDVALRDFARAIPRAFLLTSLPRISIVAGATIGQAAIATVSRLDDL